MTISYLGQMVFTSLIAHLEKILVGKIHFSYLPFIGLAWFILQFLNIDKQIERLTNSEKLNLENDTN